MYRSEDLEAYARELHPSKASLLLLNKADLLLPELRVAWADYFDALGVRHAFWSAKVAADGVPAANEGDCFGVITVILTLDNTVMEE